MWNNSISSIEPNKLQRIHRIQRSSRRGIISSLDGQRVVYWA